MRIIGLDVGSVTVGVAVSDEMGVIAQPAGTWRRKDVERDMAEMCRLIAEYQAELILIGLPLNMNGSEGPSAQMAREFAAALAEATDTEIIFRDERLSTVAAEKILLSGDVSRKKRKQVIDSMAAVFVLQGYLDSLHNSAL
ncbi:MAG: Holliday junction resolvase RuvX [Bacillota bacterium]|nr:Holliday junction resolvase RuvX [Bacillota bacterium]